MIKALFSARCLLGLGLALSLVSLGCAPALRGSSDAITRAAVPAAIDTTLDKLGEPKTRQEVLAIAGSPEMRRAIMDLSESVTEGVGQGLGREAMAASMQRLMGQLAHSFMVAMLDSMRALGPTLARTLREDFGPALRASLRDEVGPGIASVFDSPELQRALGRTAEAVAHDAVLGSNAALAELAEKRKHDEGGQPLGTVAQLFAGRSYLLLGLGLLLLVLVPLAWMLWQLTTVRRYLEQVSGKSPRELRRSMREAR
jgi:hypothetical protein